MNYKPGLLRARFELFQFLSVSLLTSHYLHAAVLYVDAASVSPAAPYTSWGSAATTLQEAIDVAESGDVVLVTNGVYRTGGRALLGHSVSNRIHISENIAVQSVNGPEVTIIEGAPDAEGSDGYGVNAVRCAYLSAGTLAGFTLRSGHTTISGPESSGGGVWMASSGCVVSNCVITANKSVAGAGVAGGTVQSCLVSGNDSEVGGGLGAIFNAVIYNSRIENNSSINGGGVRSCTVYNSLLSGNYSAFGGGGNYSTFYNCLLIGNQAGHAGGGGGFYSTFVNCTIAENATLDSGPGGGVRGGILRNSIVFGNSGSLSNDVYEASAVYSCSPDLVHGSDGNMAVDPGFVSVPHITPESPCFAAGSAAYTLGTDLDGEAWNNPPSIGCDEHLGPGTIVGSLSLTLDAAHVTRAGVAHQVTANVEGRPSRLIWNFGDGSWATNGTSKVHSWSEPGSYNLSVTAYNDSNPDGVSVSLPIHLFGVSTTGLPPGMEMVPYSAHLQAINGQPPYSWSVMPRVVTWGSWGFGEYGESTVPTDLSGVVAISAGYTHSMALKSDGTVVAWGYNHNGQGTVPDGLSGVVALSAGGAHSLALKSDGTAVAWGYNGYGQCTVPVDLAGVVALSAGGDHSLALKSDGSVTAWGRNHLNQSTAPAGLSGVVAIATGWDHCLALKSDGMVVAWGSDSNGQSSVPPGLNDVVSIAAGNYHSLALKGDGTVVAWGSNGSNVSNIPAGLSGVVDISAGNGHSLALKSDGTVVAWGSNYNGQTALPAGLGGVTMIAAGGFHNLVLRSPGAGLPDGLTCSSSGVVSGTPVMAGVHEITIAVTDGTGETAFRKLPLVVTPNPNTRPVVNSTTPAQGPVSLNEAESLLFTVSATDPEGQPLAHRWLLDGSPVGTDTASFLLETTWGDAGHHDLACVVSDGLWTNQVFATWTVAVEDVPLEITTSVLPAGMEMTPYLTQLQAANGPEPYSYIAMPRGVAWGANFSGQSTVPPGLVDAIAIAVGWSHSLALRHDGTVIAWGDNYSGQKTIPVGLGDVVAISAGGSHSLALMSDGTVAAWGDNSSGQISVPAGLGGVTAIAAGSIHSLALKSDGTVVAWGGDFSGQSTVPAGLAGVTAISAGGSHSLALMSDGTVVAWGDNSTGESTVPAGLVDVVAISAGGSHSLALKSDGTVVAWGDNGSGQCTIPAGLEDVVAISAGGSHCLALTSDGIVVAWGNDWSGKTTVPTGVDGVAMIAAGGTHSLVWRLPGVALPDGLACTVSGELQGFPTTAGSYEVTFEVTDADGTSAYRKVPLDILPNPNARPVLLGKTPSQRTVTIDETGAQSFQVIASDPEGQPLSYSWRLNGVPVGDNSPGFLLETNWGDDGYYELTSVVSDGLWTNQVSASWSVVVRDIPLEITTSSLPAGMVMTPYSVQLQGTNGLTPYTWSAFPRHGIAWGDDSSGQSTVPAGLGDVVAIAAGGRHNLALKGDGTVVAWGSNSTGQSTVPAGLSGVVAVAAGSDHSLAVKSDGTVVAWGGNGSGQSTVPSDLSGVIAVSAGWSRSLALKSDGTVVAWGDLFDFLWGSNTPPPGLNGVKAIASGFSHDLALKGDGTVEAWGFDWVTFQPIEPPAGLDDVVAIAAGDVHGLALKSDGTVVAWGNNDFGQSTVPAGLTGVIGISAGDYHSLALKSDGSVVVWGSDSSGQSTVPAGLANVEMIAAGGSHSLVLRSHGAALPAGLTFTSDGLLHGSPAQAGSHEIPFEVTDADGKAVSRIFHLDVVAAPDTDQDGLPDEWEDTHGLNSASDVGDDGADGDPDDDGHTNAMELAAGTHPRNAGSVLKATPASGPVNVGGEERFRFIFETVPGKRYEVQRATNLVLGDWTNISPALTAVNPLTVFETALPVENAPRYYRATLVAP